MTTFWIAIALLCAAAVGILFFPLWRQRLRQGRWSPIGLAAVFAIAPIALVLYQQVSTWDPAIEQRVTEGARLVEELAERLEQNPGDVEGWLVLARSYMALGRYEQGRNAYREAWGRTPFPDDELKIAFAEAQILTDRAALTGEAGELVEEVLASQPGNPKALWYGGFVAREAGREADTRTRWSRLLELGPPEDVANVVRTQLAALGESATAQPSPGGSATATGFTIQLNVTLGPGRAVEQLGPNASLFIFARAPGQRAPVAVIREPASAVPGQFTLSDAKSMLGDGRSLADFQELTLVARLSVSGQAIEQPGDWFAQTVFRPSDGGDVALVIDQVVQ